MPETAKFYTIKLAGSKLPHGRAQLSIDEQEKKKR
jgi:hypothetical protein